MRIRAEIPIEAYNSAITYIFCRREGIIKPGSNCDTNLNNWWCNGNILITIVICNGLLADYDRPPNGCGTDMTMLASVSTLSCFHGPLLSSFSLKLISYVLTCLPWGSYKRNQTQKLLYCLKAFWGWPYCIPSLVFAVQKCWSTIMVVGVISEHPTICRESCIVAKILTLMQTDDALWLACNQVHTQQDYYGQRCGTLLHSYCTGTYTEVTVLLLWGNSVVTMEYPHSYSVGVPAWVLPR